MLKIKSIYLIGIKGVAMTALACYAKKLGLEVTGSDIEEEFVTDKILNQAKVEYYESFDPGHLEKNPDLVICSAAYDKNNVDPNSCCIRL